MSETEIDFDVDLRELQGQEGVDTLCDFLRAIGSELGKPVLMTPEGGSQGHPILGFDPVVNKVVLFTDHLVGAASLHHRLEEGAGRGVRAVPRIRGHVETTVRRPCATTAGWCRCCTDTA